MNRIFNFLFFLSFFSSFSFILYAVELEVITIDAFREERHQDEHTSSSYEVSSEKILLNESPTVSHLLEDQPSIDLASQGGVGGQSSVFLRGLNAEHTLILIDGIVVNDPSNPSRSFNMGLLDSLVIEKIEILPGSRGFLHGSDAIGGVINIVTKGPSGSTGDWRVFGASPLQGGGSLGLELNNQKNAAARLSFHYFKENALSAADEKLGNTEKDGMQKLQANLKGFWEVKRNLSLDYSFQYSHQTLDLDRGGGVGQDDPNYEAVDILINSKVFARYEMRKKHIFKTGLGYHYTNRSSENFADSQDTTESLGIYTALRVKPEFLYEYQGRKFDLFMQTHYSFERAEIYSSFAGNTSEDTVVDGVDYTMGLKVSSPKLKKFLWELGARYSGNPDLDGDFTYLLGIGYWFGKLKLRSHLSSGFKNPSLFQLFATNFGNVNLGAERSQSFELGADYTFNKKMKLNMNYYQINLEDQIIFTTGYVNGGDLKTQGVEVTFEHHLNKNWKTRVWGNFLKLNEKSLRKPEKKWGASLSYEKENFSSQLKFKFTGEREDKNFLTSTDVTLKAYTTFDLLMNYKINSKLTLGLNVLNILNTDYTEVFGYGTKGINFLASLKGSF